MSGPQPLVSDADFIKGYQKHGPTKLARILGMGRRSVMDRRARIEERYKINIKSGIPHPGGEQARVVQHPQRYELKIETGQVLVGSDAHIWPGKPNPCIKAFIQFCKEIRPKAVVLNGDVMDFPQISRHDPLGWEQHHSVQLEIEAAQDTLSLIEGAAGRVPKVWSFGNHDARFEKRLALEAREYAKVHGFHLKDHFPLWAPCWSVWINNHTVIKHRWKGGQHAPFNNTMRAGTNIITGHLHSAKVIPYTDYNGTRYGVDNGCLCDPEHAAFLYTEDNPKDWRQGFCVLTFHKGRLLQPQLALMLPDGRIDYCGQAREI